MSEAAVLNVCTGEFCKINNKFGFVYMENTAAQLQVKEQRAAFYDESVLVRDDYIMHSYRGGVSASRVTFHHLVKEDK